MDVNTVFSRLLLSALMKDVRKVTTPAERKGAWVYKHIRDHWEFQGPKGFYWNGSATNAYEARYKGWSAWMRKHHPDMEAA